MSRLARLPRAAGLVLALVSAGALSLTACSQVPTDAMKQAAQQAAQQAGQAALGPALTPLLDLLRKSQADIQSGNLGAAISAMGGFPMLWEKAGPVIQPLAGEKWGAIDSAAKGVISTFGSGAKPDAAAATSAISALLAPLSALAGSQ